LEEYVVDKKTPKLVEVTLQDNASWTVEATEPFNQVEDQQFRPTDFGKFTPEGQEEEMFAVSNGEVIVGYRPG